jgi:hypothetical protein
VTVPAASSCFTAVWLVGWTAATLWFDAIAAVGIAQQFRTLAYTPADGVVTRSEVKAVRNGRGEVSRRLEVEYAYDVDGQRYTGTQYCYGAASVAGDVWERAGELAVGTSVRVYHDPADPAEAVLHRGPAGFHVSAVWFLTPFNVVMLFGWLAFGPVGRRPADPLAPLNLTRTDAGWRLRLPGWAPVVVFLAVLLALSVVGLFVWGFGFQFDPPVWLAAVLYVGVVAAAIRLAARHRPRYLEVDELARVVRVPVGDGAEEVPFTAIRAVNAAGEKEPDDEDESGPFHCDLVRADRDPLRLATYTDPDHAAALAAWLRARVGIAPAAGTQPA